MKKICIFILITLLLLGSCSPSDVTEDTADNTNNITEETAADDFLAELQLEVSPGVASSTLEYFNEITPFKTKEEVRFNTAPIIYTEGQYTYVFRCFPEDLAGADQYTEYVMSDDTVEINEIEIYKDNKYSEPVEVITLDGMEGKRYSPISLSHNSENDIFYICFTEEITDDEFKYVFYEFDRAGTVLSRNVLSTNILDPAICHDGMLYTINNSGYSGRAANLYVTDPRTDEKTELDEGVINFYIENGLLYYIKNAQTADYKNVQRICSYDPAAGTTATVTEMQTDEVVVSVYYDSERDVVYFTDNVDMFAYKDGEVMPVLYSYNSFISICDADSNYLFVKVGNNQIALYKLTDEPISLTNQTEVLKVCIPIEESTFEITFQTVSDIMSAVGMPVTFEFTYVANDTSNVAATEDEYVNNMAKKMLAEDTDFDIFYLTSTMSELFDGKYYEDLAAYPTIKDYYDKMIPGIKELSSIDGKVSLVPITLSVPSMRYTDYALTEPHEAPNTFTEFFSKYAEITENMPEDYYYTGGSVEMMFMSTWFKELASNYLSKTISDEIAENDLVTLFETITSLDKYDKIYIGTDYKKKNRVFSEMSNLGMEAHEYANDEELWIALPAIGEDYKTSVSGSFIAVNPKSANKELALKFVTYYLNTLITGDEYTYKGIHYFEQDEIDAENSGVDYEGSQYTSFKEQIANSIHMTTADNYYSFVRDLYLQINDGTLTPEEAASRTLRYLKMIRDE